MSGIIVNQFQPRASLPQKLVQELIDVFASLAADGTTVLVATHDLALARRRFARCLAVNGTLTASTASSTPSDTAVEPTASCRSWYQTIS